MGKVTFARTKVPVSISFAPTKSGQSGHDNEVDIREELAFANLAAILADRLAQLELPLVYNGFASDDRTSDLATYARRCRMPAGHAKQPVMGSLFTLSTAQ